ncbi:NACHT domain-containing protein [Desulfosporosinus hippei]|uniref:NACHT domain-containing protein n=1 Tax=Desulfosporosinus hippei DSM 8344 TaxID=1121419 RepID=A0A1G8CB65_9FIRM|nr:hypothetical protein [Desulfosporosinus hippei]SDH42757.1 hypothetical protein SAMN05443529_11352 [Desulfosporosinus hippei DSM 8344]
MYDVNWDMFNIKNKDKTTAFETMCRHLFMRKFSICGYNFQSNYNQTGLETQPVKNKDEWYGFQCKFSTSNNNNALYKEIYDSLKKVYTLFPNTLNHIYIYTNADIKPICTDEELADKEKSSDRINISRDAKNHNVQLHWIIKENFISILNETANLDIYKLYFSSEQELAFMDSSISVEDRTFLNSNSFLNLLLNNEKLSDKWCEIYENKVSIILGSAGTGKTEILKIMYIICQEEFLDNYKNSTSSTGNIPVYIRFRECITGDLEGLIRQRLSDYNINITDSKYNFVYFLDGLDEIANKYIDKIISYISIVNQRVNTKSIIISSRKNSINLSFLYRSISPLNRYIINKTNVELIDLYFEKSQDVYKLTTYKSIKSNIETLLREIDDIFSIKLLWQTIEVINANTAKIELIEKSISYLTTSYSKINTLPIPEIKHENIENLGAEISYFLHNNNKLNISLHELQEIISKEYEKLSYLGIDEVISCIAEMFFDVVLKEKNQYIYSFKHKRYQEYFLYKKIVEIFFDDPFILRELHLLTNKDFILNIFMKKCLTESLKKNRDALKTLTLRFYEAYLGKEYWSDYQDSLIGLRYDYGVGSESYLGSKYLLDSLTIKNNEELFLLLDNEALSLKNFLTSENFWLFIKDHYRFNNYDIREMLIKYYSLNEDFIKDAINNDPCAYWHSICMIDGVNPKDIYQQCIGSIELEKNTDFDYIESHRNEEQFLVVGFFKMALEVQPDIVIELVDTISVDHLEVICYELLRNDKIYCLVTNETAIVRLREQIVLRIEKSLDDKYQINTLVLYGILTKKITNKDFLEERFNKVNIRHHITWERNIELNSYLTNVLSNQNKLYSIDCKLGTEIREIIINNYSENKGQILDLIINSIKQYNFIHDNWFFRDNSKLIGFAIATLNFDDESLKSFINKLFQYQSVISLSIVLYTVFIENPNLFFVLNNEDILSELHAESSQRLSYYDYNSETDFMFSAMVSKYNLSASNKLLINGLNNSIYRPAFRKENLVSYVLPLCLLMADQNHWFNKIEMEILAYKIFDMLKIMNDTTDRGDEQSYFKYVLESCLPDSPILNSLYGISSYNGFSNDSANYIVVDFSQINKDNIKDYYKCNIADLNYTNFNFWRQLISLGMSFERDLSSLFEILKEYRFPESHRGGPCDYFSVITAVLLSDNNLRDYAIQFIIEQGGRSGLFNMIRAFSLTGNSKDAQKYINQLFKLTEALVYPNKKQYVARQYKATEVSMVSNVVYNSEKDDWFIRESERKLINKNDVSIKIIWDDVDRNMEFNEDWAINHPDKHAYKVNYYILHNDTRIEEFSLVYVDGYRALLPVPKIGTNIIPRKKYKIALLVNDEKNLNSYIRRSGLIVE